MFDMFEVGVLQVISKAIGVYWKILELSVISCVSLIGSLFSCMVPRVIDRLSWFIHFKKHVSKSFSQDRLWLWYKTSHPPPQKKKSNLICEVFLSHVLLFMFSIHIGNTMLDWIGAPQLTRRRRRVQTHRSRWGLCASHRIFSVSLKYWSRKQ